MRLIEKARVAAGVLRWRLTWDRGDIDYRPAGLPYPKFLSAREAVGLIPDDATVLSCGLGSSGRCSIFFWAVREAFELTGMPMGLTWISVGAQGGRGRLPGTVEELALPGLVRRYISGHVETARELLHLAERGRLQLHLLPQGEMALAIEAQGAGGGPIVSHTGLGTFLDPRTGGGSVVNGEPGESLVRVAGDALEYRLPRIDVAMINAPYADEHGNIYFRHAAALTESVEAARAARHNGGQVLVAVADLVPFAGDEVMLPAEDVDAVVVNPHNEQTGGIPQRRYWPMFTPEGRENERSAVQKLRFANDLLGITPRRGPAQQAVARLGAALFVREVARGATVNLGVGYGEEVVRILCEQGLHRDIVFTTETGVYGGLPAPGVYFGTAINPLRLESSAWMFHHYREHLDATLLGFLEVDSAGNVNSAMRGDRITDLVGPGGMPSIAGAAQTVIFIGGWMSGARWRVGSNGLRLERPGAPKFVERLRSVSFNAEHALGQGKRVFYVTHVGVFALTPEGLLLTDVMPGIDVERDILAHSGARILQPPGAGPEAAPLAVATGRSFRLSWPG